jgi:hypothetical protein
MRRYPMKLARLLVAAIFVVGFSVAAYAIHETKPAETRMVPPGADAGELANYITRQNPYDSWELWPGKGKFYKGREPHGALLTTYVNDIALRSIREKSGMADGSIVVKENYTADKKLAGITVIYKIKGYNPPGGDWFWAKYTPQWAVEVSGKVKSCLECHGIREANDYIYSGTVK